jgi:hypothetical protein
VGQLRLAHGVAGELPMPVRTAVALPGHAVMGMIVAVVRPVEEA